MADITDAMVKTLHEKSGASLKDCREALQETDGDVEAAIQLLKERGQTAMADITAAMVKELRDKTSAGMMDCKKALQDTDGDMQAAAQLLQEKGQAQAAKRSGRVAAEGRVAARIVGNVGAMVELNCETDFVARNADFAAFVGALLDHVLAADPGESQFAGSQMAGTGKSVEESTTEFSGKIGEKLVSRRYTRLQAGEGSVLGSYVHSNDRIGVLVELSGANGADAAQLAEVSSNVAMQVASMNPEFNTEADVDQDWLRREREVAMAQARETGKPENILEKIAEGKVKSRLKDVCLVHQDYVKGHKQSVSQYVTEAGKAAGAPNLAVAGFVRFGLGEGVDTSSAED